jgi:hypothetical protein
MSYLVFTFGNDKQVAIDPVEFGQDAMGVVLDKLAIKHSGVKDVELRPGVPAQGVQTDHGLSHGDHPSGISLPSVG